MPMTWTDQADAKLLVAIIATNTVKLDWKAIAEFHGNRGRPKGKGKKVVSRTEEGGDGAGVEEQGILVDAHVKMEEAF
ncbi:hypothetical protein BDW66DRAFT_154597 [Aspergillus desertorum]